MSNVLVNTVIIFSILYLTYAVAHTNSTIPANRSKEKSLSASETEESASGSSSTNEESVEGSSDGSVSESDDSNESKLSKTHVGLVISNALDKADQYSQNLETVIKRADTEVSEWSRRIQSIKSHFPGIGYGGSLITLYYTVWPFLKDFRKRWHQIAKIGRTIAGWFTVRKPVATRNKGSITRKYSRVTQRQRSRASKNAKRTRRPS